MQNRQNGGGKGTARDQVTGQGNFFRIFCLHFLNPLLHHIDRAGKTMHTAYQNQLKSE